jgi:hypothetical protein
MGGFHAERTKGLVPEVRLVAPNVEEHQQTAGFQAPTVQQKSPVALVIFKTLTAE